MDIAKLSKCGTIRNFEKDSFICIEGNEGHTAFFILKGYVEVVLGTFDRKSKNLVKIPEGSIFGEMSMLEDAPRSATIVAGEGGVTVLEINKDDFLNLMKTEPELAYNLLRTLYNRIEATMKEAGTYLVAYSGEIRRNKLYIDIANLSLQSFIVIVAQKEDYAYKLLAYLSHTLSELNKELMSRVNR